MNLQNARDHPDANAWTLAFPEAAGVLFAQVRACLPAKRIPVSDAIGSPPSEPGASRFYACLQYYAPAAAKVSVR